MNHRNITKADATDGVWTSDIYTMTSSRSVSLNNWGEDLFGLDIQLQVSTHNSGDGSNDSLDTFVPFRSIPIGIIEDIVLDEGVKIRVQVSRLTEDGQVYNVTTGYQTDS